MLGLRMLRMPRMPRVLKMRGMLRMPRIWTEVKLSSMSLGRVRSSSACFYFSSFLYTRCLMVS